MGRTTTLDTARMEEKVGSGLGERRALGKEEAFMLQSMTSSSFLGSRLFPQVVDIHFVILRRKSLGTLKKGFSLELEQGIRHLTCPGNVFCRNI